MQLPRVWADIDLGAVADNLHYCRSLLPPECAILGVVKADAYGHGAQPIAATLVDSGIDMLGVGDSHEAIRLREWGIETPILVFGAVVDGEIPDLIQHRILPSIHSPERIDALDRAAARLGAILPVHLLVDTGMSVLGVMPERALEHVEHIHLCRHLQLCGVGTHLAAPRTDRAFSLEQLDRFRSLIAGARRRGLELGQLHASSSVPLANYRDVHFDMVRLGGFLYGIDQSESDAVRADRDTPSPIGAGVEPVLSLRTQVVHMRDLATGTPVSYDGTFRAARPTRIATLAVGYHDGYLTHLSNRAAVLIRGRRAPVVGRVTMDYTIVDVTDVPGTRVGDVATLLGRDGDDRIRAAELAGWAGTVAYSIPSHLGPRVVRRYIGQAASLREVEHANWLSTSQRSTRAMLFGDAPLASREEAAHEQSGYDALAPQVT